MQVTTKPSPALATDRRQDRLVQYPSFVLYPCFVEIDDVPWS